MKALKIFLAFLTVAIAIIFLLLVIYIRTLTHDVYNLKLKVKNNWNKPIVVLYSTDSTKFEYRNYDYYVRDAIQPNEVKPIPTRNFWEEVIDFSASKKLYLFFYDLDTIKKYRGMEYIVKNHRYIANLSYTKKDLIDRNWVVNFFH